MVKNVKKLGQVVFWVQSVRESAGGPVLTVKVWFEDGQGNKLAEVGTSEVRYDGNKGCDLIKCGPVEMLLTRLDLPGLDSTIEQMLRQGRIQ